MTDSLHIWVFSNKFIVRAYTLCPGTQAARAEEMDPGYSGEPCMGSFFDGI